jgi:hypothetical protein
VWNLRVTFYGPPRLALSEHLPHYFGSTTPFLI